MASVFQLLKRIEMNMVEEEVVTFGFNKENPRNYLAPSSHQSRRKSTKVAPPKAKGAKLDSGGGSTSYSAKQGGEDKCWKCGGPHKNFFGPNPL